MQCANFIGLHDLLLLKWNGFGTRSDSAVEARRDSTIVSNVDGEGHDGRGIADARDGDAGRGAVVGVRARVGAPVARPFVVVTWEGVTTIAQLQVGVLKLLQPIRLDERYLVAVQLVVVVRLRLIDVPETEATAWKVPITTVHLPILNQEVLRIRCPIFPHLQHLVAVFHIR